MVADGSGIIADLLTIGALGVPELAPAALAAQEINTPLEQIGLINSAIDIYNGDPSGFLSPIMLNNKAILKTFGSRIERLIPIAGIIGNCVSLSINLKPQIIWR